MVYNIRSLDRKGERVGFHERGRRRRQVGCRGLSIEVLRIKAGLPSELDRRGFGELIGDAMAGAALASREGARRAVPKENCRQAFGLCGFSVHSNFSFNEVAHLFGEPIWEVHIRALFYITDRQGLIAQCVALAHQKEYTMALAILIEIFAVK
jgi:hypothetical protein